MSQAKTSKEGIVGQASRRTLNFFWIVDVSGSMARSKIQTVNFAISDVLPAIKKLEEDELIDIKLSVIKFGDNAEWHIGPDPVPLKSFKWSDMVATTGKTATAQAINLLADALDVEKIGGRNVPPVCILLSDGMCTESSENYELAIDKLNSIPWGKKAVRLSIGIAEQEGDYDKEQLDKFISPYLRNEGKVVTLNADTPRKLLEFIRTATTVAIQGASKSKTNANGSGINSAPVNIHANDFDNSAPDFLAVEANEEWSHE
jgi:uncharacterized protein YegL